MSDDECRPPCTGMSIGYHPETRHPREVMMTFADGITEVYRVTGHSGAALLPNGWHFTLGSRVTCDPQPMEEP